MDAGLNSWSAIAGQVEVFIRAFLPWIALCVGFGVAAFAAKIWFVLRNGSTGTVPVAPSGAGGSLGGGTIAADSAAVLKKTSARALRKNPNAYAKVDAKSYKEYMEEGERAKRREYIKSRTTVTNIDAATHTTEG